MRIDPLPVSREPSAYFPPQSTPQSPTACSLQMKECGSIKRSPFLKHLAELCLKIFEWFRSFFYPQEGLKEEFSYEKKEGEGGKILYRLIHRKDRTDGIIKIAPRYASLEELVHPEKGIEIAIGNMVLEVIERENIDYLAIPNLKLAFQVFKGGPSIKGTASFSLKSQKPWDQFVVNTIKEAKERKDLTDEDREVGLAVDETLIREVITQYGDNEKVAIAVVGEIEQVLGYSFDLGQMAKRADGIEILKSSIEKLIAKRAVLNKPKQKVEEIELSIDLNHLFTIMKALNVELPQEFYTKSLKNAFLTRKGFSQT